MRQISYVYHVALDAFYTFLADDGWAIASHIALSTLMALFPFLIVLTSLAAFFGSKDLADQAAGLMLQVWPIQVADAISGEVHDVLTTTRGDEEAAARAAGADAFLVKPVSPRALATVLLEATRRAAAAT